jgi:hypothetical protein
VLVDDVQVARKGGLHSRPRQRLVRPSCMCLLVSLPREQQRPCTQGQGSGLQDLPAWVHWDFWCLTSTQLANASQVCNNPACLQGATATLTKAAALAAELLYVLPAAGGFLGLLGLLGFRIYRRLGKCPLCGWWLAERGLVVGVWRLVVSGIGG